MATIRFNNKQDLVDALEARRKFWEKHDTEVLKQHQKARRKEVKEFRDACIKYSKMTLEELDALTMAEGGSRFGQRIGEQLFAHRCPKSQIAVLDRNLKVIQTSRQERFHVSESGQWATVFDLLMYDPDRETEVC